MLKSLGRGGGGSSPPGGSTWPNGTVQNVTLGAGATNNQAVNAGVSYLRMTPNAGGSTLNGLTPAAALVGGEIFTIWNVSATLPMDLAHGAGGSTNPFICPNGATLTLDPNSGISVWYDVTSAGFRVGF